MQKSNIGEEEEQIDQEGFPAGAEASCSRIPKKKSLNEKRLTSGILFGLPDPLLFQCLFLRSSQRGSIPVPVIRRLLTRDLPI
jgi:hypothetical protein